VNKPRFTAATLQEYKELLDNPENLIGVAFFIKEEGQVICVGDIAGTGVASAGDNLWEAIESYDMISRMSDADIGKEFGAEVVSLRLSDEELLAKTAAIESLRASLKGREGIVDVKDTPTSIVVIVAGEGAYDGPWEWEGFSVHAEAEV